MINYNKKLNEIISNCEKYSALYIFSTEEFILQEASDKVIALLEEKFDDECTKIAGPVPDIEQAVAALGTISMFGGKRVVHLSLLEISAMSDKEVAEVCELCTSCENAVIVITSLFKDDKSKTTKKVKALIAAVENSGVSFDIVKPTKADTKAFVIQCAKELGCAIAPNSADELIERCGTDYYVLQNEIAKLAATVGYTEINSSVICELGTLNLQADVFEMTKLVAAGDKAKTLAKLKVLLELQNDSIAILGALSSTFIDMYRVKCAQQYNKNYSNVYKDFNYKGSDYRLKMAGQSAAKYSMSQLKKIIEILTNLDLSMKSVPTDNIVLLQVALCEILNVR